MDKGGNVKIDKKIDIRVKYADSFFKRLKGLMFTSKKPDIPLLFVPGSRIHTCFMKFTIDVLYLDKDGKILGKERIRPWKLGMNVKGTAKVLEGQVGFADELMIGDRLNCKREV